MAIDRIYSQYRNNPKSVAWYNILPTIGGELDAAYSDIRTMYDIDSQIGAQLDLIGRVVVQPRNIVFPIDADVTEFGDTDTEFGDTETAFSSAIGFANVGLTDEEYKLVLKSKIQRNTSDVTTESIIAAVNTVLVNANVVQLVNGEDMTFSLNITGFLSATEISLLTSVDFIPTPQGVLFTGYEIVPEAFADITLGDVTSAALGDVEPAGDIVSTLEDVIMVATNAITWDTIYSGGGEAPGHVGVDAGNGDVWYSGENEVKKWDAALETSSDQAFTGSNPVSVAVNGSTHTAMVPAFGDVFERIGGVGAWVDSTPAYNSDGASIDNSNNDQFVCKVGFNAGVDGRIFKRTGGAGAWNVLATFPNEQPVRDVSVDSSNQDVWCIWEEQVYKSAGGVGAFIQQGSYPEAQVNRLSVDSSTGDVWCCTAGNPNIYKLSGGVGSYILVFGFPGSSANDIDVNPTTGEVYVADENENKVWRATT